MQYTYLFGTVVSSEEAVSPVDDDSIVIRLDATPNQGEFEGEELFIFDKLLGEDDFPFEPGDKVEVLIQRGVTCE